MSARIAIDAIPNQSLTIRLDGRRYVITIKDIGVMMAVSIERDGVMLIQNTRAVAGFFLLPYPVLQSDAGNFLFTNTNPQTIPYYTDFGASSFLVYVSPADVALSA